MKKSIESIRHFCLIQLEILKDREHRLRKEIENCKIQKEFLRHTLKDLGTTLPSETDKISSLLSITGTPSNEK
jgi:FtsZ-binding cell division protein ZapB